MVNYLIRVAYSDIDSATLDRLNAELAKYNVAGALAGDDGKGYYLPAGEYCYSGNESINEVRDGVFRVAESIKSGASILVLEATNLSWVNLRPVEAQHPAMGNAAQ